MEFGWDNLKAKVNQRKHGISFEEASTCFYDPYGLDFYDEDHSEEEDRYILLARSNRGRVLVVIYTERGDRLRIISARKATPKEEEFYYAHRI